MDFKMSAIKNRKTTISLFCLVGCVITFCFSSCSKVEYRDVESPAYIRVFNNLTYTVSLNNKEEPQPFFCMFIDPEFDASGKPIAGLVMSDFLDKRSSYASPNPAHSGLGTSRFNPEYPGKELVPTAPILNGFDLTNWAKVSSGKRRFLFMSRPISNIPFAQLPDEQQRHIFLDTTITLAEHEVYTIHLLQKDFKTKQNGLYVRQENFHKQAFSDTLSYVNFYNLSAKGFWSASTAEKNMGFNEVTVSLRYGIRDTVNAYLTHISIDTNANGTLSNNRIPEFSYQYAGTLYRNNSNPVVAPYYSFPVFLKTGNKIYTNTWQFLQLFAPAINPVNSELYPDPPIIPYAGMAIIPGEYAYAQFDTPRYPHRMYDILPNMIIQVHSGVNNPQSFGVVNTIEVVNGNIYLTTIQRKYPQPVY